MAAITVRQLDEETKRRLRLRAAANGRSMEAEARAILVQALAPSKTDLSWAEQLLQVSIDIGGVDLPEVEDEPAPAADLDDR